MILIFCFCIDFFNMLAVFCFAEKILNKILIFILICKFVFFGSNITYMLWFKSLKIEIWYGLLFLWLKEKAKTQVLPASPLTKGGAHLPTASPFAKRGDMNKGGYRHTSKPQVDQGLLMKVFSNNSNLLGNMGIYERISRSQGCDPKGLIKLLPLIRGLVELEPTCEIHQSCLRKAIFSILLEDGALNDSKWSGAVWTGMKEERVGVLLFHLRRLAGTDLKVAASKLTGAEYLQLQHVVETIKTKEKPEIIKTKEEPDAAPPR